MAEASIEKLARDVYEKSLKIMEKETGVCLERLLQLAKADKENRIIILEEGDTH